jgi:hypothetical protein
MAMKGYNFKAVGKLKKGAKPRPRKPGGGIGTGRPGKGGNVARPTRPGGRARPGGGIGTGRPGKGGVVGRPTKRRPKRVKY